MPYLREQFGNASSRTHDYGHAAAAAVETARQQVADLLQAAPQEVTFTSGATEANNLALKGASAHLPAGSHLVTCVTEHHAVLDVFDHLEARGFRVTRLPVDADGLLCLQSLERALAEDARLLSVMAANNETGVLQPLGQIAERLQDHDVIWHCDAAQAFGKVPLPLKQIPIDLLSLSSHKIYGPKGQGALIVRRRRPPLRLQPQIEGGGQERGIRGGTLNVPGIVGLGAAAELMAQEGATESVRMASLRDRLQARLLQDGPRGSTVNGHQTLRLPHALSMSFPGADPATLLPSLRDIALSSGSACSSGSTSPSHVLTAMGLDPSLAVASLRFGLGRSTTADQIDRAATRVLEVLGSCGNGSRP